MERYATQLRWAGDALDQHPANWLRAGCWKDEPAGRTDPRAIDGTTGIIVTRHGAQRMP